MTVCNRLLLVLLVVLGLTVEPLLTDALHCSRCFRHGLRGGRRRRRLLLGGLGRRLGRSLEATSTAEVQLAAAAGACRRRGDDAGAAAAVTDRLAGGPLQRQHRAAQPTVETTQLALQKLRPRIHQTWNWVTFCDPATQRPGNPATRRPSLPGDPVL